MADREVTDREAADDDVLSADDRSTLLRLAVAAIQSGLEREPIAGLQPPASPALRELGASFVTLEDDGRLLGCIGTLRAVRPLYEDVMQNAYRSAFADPRLPPVSAHEFEVMDVKISVLTAPVPFEVAGRDELHRVLRPGVDGLLLTDGKRRSTFLPSVWEKVRGPRHFVDLLLAKGGWRGARWPPGMQTLLYRTVEFADPGPRPAPDSA
ncbi:MAG: AmmeMemoRadiSam system protein A, partial [Acidimicrobiales bacterium]